MIWVKSIPGRENKWCKDPACHMERKIEVAEELEATGKGTQLRTKGQAEARC